MGLAILITALIAALAGGTVIFALRGRPIDNHPICRKCGFDLFGLSESTRCPECGTELSAQAIRLGHRAVRRGALALGILVLMPSLLMTATLSVAAIKRVDLYAYKPVWWLLREADAPALEELRRRLAAGKLSDANLASIVSAALKAQANVNSPWLAGWGDLVEMSHASGKVSDEQWKQYGRHAAPLTITARPRFRRGDPLPLSIECTRLRVGSESQLRATVEVQSDWLVDRRSNFFDRNLLRPFYQGTGIRIDKTLMVPPTALAHISDGLFTMKMPVSVTVCEQRRPDRSGNDGFVCSYDEHLIAKSILLPREQPAVELVRDSAQRAAMEGALAIGGQGNRCVHVGPSGAWLDIDCNDPPVGLAFDLSARDPRGNEWPMQSVSIAAHARGWWTGRVAARDLKGFNADRIDVMLRPNPAVAVNTVDVLQIWDVPIVFKDVAVVWDKATTRPFLDPATSRPMMTTRRGAS